jgi:pimeloyl-ACP methyl ester carboxylesterase
MLARVRRMLRPLLDRSPEEHQRALRDVRKLIHAPGTMASLLGQNACMLDSVTSFPVAPGDLARLAGKILIIESDDDPAVRAPERAHLRAMVPGAEVRTFQGTGHITALVQPDEFVSAVEGFLTAACVTVRSAPWQLRSAPWQRQSARWQRRSARWQCRSVRWQGSVLV